MNKELRKKICELLDRGEDQAYREMVLSAADKRWSDFHAALDNLKKLVDLDVTVGCSTELA